ncbi:ABC transporter ATP-binding protein [Halococcus agarilyticus]|uniref:ABC transporter ATP-binding protein n=1 Tax=Halococcus agarilyticus TaxID=1232219 RepID=UPI00067780C8|nr:ABC transporter ATP-binding protein [Halococcus agarilyticus]
MTDSRGELRDVRDAVDGHPMRRLFEYVTPYWKRLSAGIVASFVMRIARLVPALAVAAAIDRAIRGSGEAGILARIGLVTAESVPAGDPQVALLYRLALIAAVAWVVQAITQFASRYLFQSAAQLIQHDLRDDTYAHMQSLSMDFFDDHESGALMAVLNSDVNRLENFFNNEIRQIIRAIVMFGVVGAVMLYEAPKLALIALAPMPILGLFTGRFMLWIEPRYKRIRELVSGLNTRLANNLGGVDVIKSFDRYGIERERVAGFSEAYRDRKIEVIRIRKAFFSSQRLLIGLSFVAVLVLGGRAIVDTPAFGVAEGITVGSFTLFFLFLRRLDGPLQRIGKTANKWQKAKASAERIFGILGHEPTISSPTDPVVPERLDGTVAFEDVTFSYETGDSILRGVNLDIEAGETVGLAGTSGSGKSTLLKLLTRFYDVDSGAVRIDGVDVREYDAQALRNRIGVVEQDPYMFSGTVRENIAYGDREAFRSIVAARTDADSTAPDAVGGGTGADSGVGSIDTSEAIDFGSDLERRVREVARAAGADGFIRDLPNGYDTLVGERGVKLSGGQRQRLSIARAILNDPDVIVLDEATSDVDTETEQLIQENLDRLCADRTAFVIAHRLSTIRDADRIVVMDEGRVIETGTHDDLVQAGGAYADLWATQVDTRPERVSADD